MHAIRYDDGPLTVELVKTDSGWSVTANASDVEVVEPFTLSNQSPGIAFATAFGRVSEQIRRGALTELVYAAASLRRMNQRRHLAALPLSLLPI